MTTEHAPSGSPRLLILSSEGFGAAVAARLSNRFPSEVRWIDPDGTHPSHWPHADLMVLATSQERLNIAHGVDRAAFAWNRPWFPILAGARDIRCGPVVVPGRTACHDCYLKRREQHGGAEAAGRLQEGPAGGAPPAPTGYPEHHVGIAAGLARQAVAEAFTEPEPDSLGATVRIFNQIEGSTGAYAVLATDRCPRCRPARTGTDLWSLFREMPAAPERAPANARGKEAADRG